MNKTKSPKVQKSISITNELWQAAINKAREEDETLSKKISAFLEAYAQHGDIAVQAVKDL